MGFWFGFLCGLLFIPSSILAGLYYFFNYSPSYTEQREEQLEYEKRKEKEQEYDLDDMPSALYASYFASRQQQQGDVNGIGFANATNGVGLIPEHLDPRYQFAGWISVKRIPEVDHRVIEPSFKKDSRKKGAGPNGLMDDMTGAAAQDPRFTYFDSYNPHLTLPPSLQARFKDSKYAVIKGTTMFIYENEHMSECLGIITLPHYQVSVPGNQKDSHIYSKRNPIWLKYQPNPNHTRHSTASSDSNPLSSKDYYLSMVNSVDKEDLYFTLLRCSKLKLHSQSCLREIPKRDSTLFDKSAMNTLIRTIHSNEHQFQAAWLNAVLGRIFLGVYKTPQVKDMVFQKLVDKLTRVRLPNFLNDIRMKSVHLGDGVPMITRPKLLTLKPNGDLIMDMSLLYQGGFRAEVEAEAIVTVTKKIQPIKVSLVLAITLIRLEGRMQVWIKPPPCNRLWYGFYQKPQVEMKIEPVVSDKHIKSNLIIKAIENKMLEAIAETMVLPNMDDVPFSDSEGVGGIFGEEILPGGETADTAATSQQTSKAQPLKRSHSPGTRAATINLAEVSNTPRSAIEIPSDSRHRTETMSVADLYMNIGNDRPHVSLTDEPTQLNHTYDNQSKAGSLYDGDTLRPGVYRSGQQQTTDATDAASVRTLHVPGNHGGRPSAESGVGRQGHEGFSYGTNNNSKLHHRKTTETTRGRSGSMDPNISFSYSTGSTTGNISDSNPFPAMDTTRTVEDHWSQYGISEYEPSVLEGGKLNTKDKKKHKEKNKNPEKATDADKSSVYSKDSGDTGSTYTGNNILSESVAQPSNSSHSTNDSPSSRDKFSLSKMFQGFMKKHTKGTHSGPSLPTTGTGSSDRSGFDTLIEDDHEDGPELMEDGEGDSRVTQGSPYGPLGLMSSTSAAAELLQRMKFGSTPNLSSTMYEGELAQGEPQDSPTSVEGVPTTARTTTNSDVDSLHESYDLLRIKGEDSPASSVYAASLFSAEDSQLNQANGMRSMTTSNTHTQNPSLINISSAFRKLRTQSHGDGGPSKEDLSVPLGDASGSLGQQLLQQKHALSGSENPSQSSLLTDGYDSSTGSNGYSDHVRQSDEHDVMRDKQLPKDVSEPATSGHSSHARIGGVAKAPLIVLQKPIPHLGHAESSSLCSEGSFRSEPQGRASMDDNRLPQPQFTSSAIVNGKLGSPASNRPRRHSINHPPSISPVGYTMYPHGIGVTPASPLRKEFRRDDLDDESDFSSIVVSSTDNTSTSSTVTGERTRNKSDSFSITSSTTSSSQSNVPKDAQHLSHPSSFRSILSSLSHKAKRKSSNATPPTAPSHQGYPTGGPDSCSNFGAVGKVGIAMGRVTSTAIDGDGTFAQPSGVDEYTSFTAMQQRRSSQESSRSLQSETAKLEAGLAPLLESASLPPTQSIMGKAVAIDVDPRKEALHARPGYIGEYPTPVRMHSMLNREAAAVRQIIDMDLSQNKRRNNGDDMDDIKFHSKTCGNDLPPHDVSLSSTLPLNPQIISLAKSNSMPPPETGTLPEPLPIASNGEEIPTGMPIPTPCSDNSFGMSVKDQIVVKEHESILSGPQDPIDISDRRITSGNADQPMIRCINDTTTVNRNQDIAPSNPRIEEPQCNDSPFEQQQQQQQHLNDHQGLSFGIDVDESTEDSRYLQPFGHPVPPNSPKRTGRNIFKRLIRRKSEEALNTLDSSPSAPATPTKQQQTLSQPQEGRSLYMNPMMSQSQSSVLTASSSSAFGMPFFHKHHHQQQQNPQSNIDPSQPLEHPAIKLSYHMTFPEGVDMAGQTRAQSSEEPNLNKRNSSSSVGGGIRGSNGGGLLSRVRTRPRSSTIHAMSPTTPITRQI